MKAKYECFKNEVIKLCNKYGVCISHEDGHGSFLLVDYDKIYIDWFKNATIEKEDRFCACGNVLWDDDEGEFCEECI